jgi:hypothetical protein
MRAENTHGKAVAILSSNGARSNQRKARGNAWSLSTAASRLHSAFRRRNFYARNQRTENLCPQHDTYFTENFSEEAKTEEKQVDEENKEEAIVKIDPKTFEMKPLEVAPKLEIAGGVYLIPAEKVLCHTITGQVLNEISQATFEDAKVMCKSRGMLLMTVDDETETNDVSEFLENSGLAAESFLCSKKEAPSGCSVMLNSQIQTASCDKKINFICEAKK